MKGKSACSERPPGVPTRSVRIHDGACRDTSFSKNDGFSTPSGQRTIVTGRSRRCGSITSATAR